MKGGRLDVGVDVAECSVESDVQSGECASIAVLRVRSDALFCLLPRCARDRRPSGMGLCTSPCLPNDRGQRPERERRERAVRCTALLGGALTAAVSRAIRSARKTFNSD